MRSSPSACFTATTTLLPSTYAQDDIPVSSTNAGIRASSAAILFLWRIRHSTSLSISIISNDVSTCNYAAASASRHDANGLSAVLSTGSCASLGSTYDLSSSANAKADADADGNAYANADADADAFTRTDVSIISSVTLASADRE